MSFSPITTSPLRPKLLCAALGLLLGGAIDAHARDAHRTAYFVTFDEPGLLHYDGGVAGLVATRPRKDGARIDANSVSARAYRGFLAQRRESHLANIELQLGRPLAPTHSYAVTRSGVAVELSAHEAERIATLPGVARVTRVEDARLATYRGPGFIGADGVWSGAGAPGAIGTRGEGQVIGVIDTGSNSQHPSFANDAGCGLNSASPKLLSAVDCFSAADGVCNGAQPEAFDGFGHGVHVASTAAGNLLDVGSAIPAPTLPPPYTQISGVAPCAQVRSYKVCETNSCSGAAMQAALENAILDGVDVLNLSISGGLDPWNDYDRSLLEAVGQDIYVAVAAGNTNPFETNPVGHVNHQAPWITTVAAITHDLNAFGPGSLSVLGDNAPSALQDMVATPGNGFDYGEGLPDSDIVYPADQPKGCAPFAPNRFDGDAVLLLRGDCDFAVKIANADAAGASVVFIYNNQFGPLAMDVRAQTLPAYGLDAIDGETLRAFIENTAPAATRVRLTPATRRGDVLAGFSLRGPTPVALDVLKPDIAAPGVAIYAATDAFSGSYQRMDGTSMASPHVAGAGALLRALHPDWSPSDIHSALVTTAKREGTREDGNTPWGPDDVGTGRVALERAVRAGLTLHETYANFVAADPANEGQPATLNLPSIRDLGCDVECTYERTVTNRMTQAGTWTADYVAGSGNIRVDIDPPTFSLAPGASQTLSITFTPPVGGNMPAPAIGTVLLQETSGAAVEQALTTVVRGEGTYVYLRSAAAQVEVFDGCEFSALAENGIAEPGERITVLVPVTAHGESFGSVQAQLLPPYPTGVQVIRGTDALGSVALGVPAQASFELQLAHDAACLTDLVLQARLQSGTASWPFELSLPVGRVRPLAQDLPRAIPDADVVDGALSTLRVSQDIALDALAVDVAIEHPWVGDVRIVLTSPAGTSVTLLDRPGFPQRSFGCANRDLALRFADGADDSESVCADGNGTIWPVTLAAPVEALSAFAGESSLGDWTLRVTDATRGYSGRIVDWSLQPTPAFATQCQPCLDPDGRLFRDGFDGLPEVGLR